jgi:serine/threonine protein kinase
MAEEAKYKILGEGSYGAVLQPALPNRNIEYPANVTKIFTSKDAYLNALRQAENAKKIGPLAIKAEPYRNSFTVASLDPSIRNRIRSRAEEAMLQRIYVPLDVERRILSESAIYNNENDRNSFIEREIEKYKRSKLPKNNTKIPIYPLRLDYLGNDFHFLHKGTNYRKLREIDYKILLHQILKSFKVVKAIWDAEYIHGDIRHSNVLCQLQSGYSVPQGTITIVDFDWLYKKDIFIDEYPTFFYSHPPEGLLIFKKPRLLHEMLDNKTRDEIKTVVERELTDAQNAHSLFNMTEAVNGLVKIILDVRTKKPTMKDRRTYVYNTYMAPYIDSYGLATAFKVPFRTAWYYEKNKYTGALTEYPYEFLKTKIKGINTKEDYTKFINMRNILVDLFDDLLASDYRDRSDINFVISAFEKGLKDNNLLDLEVTKDETAMEIERLAVVAATLNSGPSATNSGPSATNSESSTTNEPMIVNPAMLKHRRNIPRILETIAEETEANIKAERTPKRITLKMKKRLNIDPSLASNNLGSTTESGPRRSIRLKIKKPSNTLKGGKRCRVQKTRRGRM